MNEKEISNAVNEGFNPISVTTTLASAANVDDDAKLAGLRQIKKSHDVEELDQKPLEESTKNQLALLVSQRDAALRVLSKQKWYDFDHKCSICNLILKCQSHVEFLL